ncbi:MAG: fluoride efflux transporter CrcB [Chlorobi bacterium]|nr:fluoride efflux transporter CrcB [Chlorobiota bacterium]
MFKIAMIVGAGGFLGTVSRYFSQIFLQRMFQTIFPIGTMTVNILGSFLIGLIYALSEQSNILSPEIRLFLAVGFCGGFTTFSSFSYNIFNLINDSGIILNLIYIIGSIVLGVIAAYAGVLTIKFF